MYGTLAGMWYLDPGSKSFSLRSAGASKPCNSRRKFHLGEKFKNYCNSIDEIFLKRGRRKYCMCSCLSALDSEVGKIKVNCYETIMFGRVTHARRPLKARVLSLYLLWSTCARMIRQFNTVFQSDFLLSKKVYVTSCYSILALVIIHYGLTPNW